MAGNGNTCPLQENATRFGFTISSLCSGKTKRKWLICNTFEWRHERIDLLRNSVSTITKLINTRVGNREKHTRRKDVENSKKAMYTLRVVDYDWFRHRQKLLRECKACTDGATTAVLPLCRKPFPPLFFQVAHFLATKKKALRRYIKKRRDRKKNLHSMTFVELPISWRRCNWREKKNGK